MKCSFARPDPEVTRSYPGVMGGAKKQDLVYLSGKEHHELHNDLNAFLRNKKNEFGDDMMPRRGNSGRKIQYNFTPEQRIDAMRDFYKTYEAKYPEVAKRYFEMHGR